MNSYRRRSSLSKKNHVQEDDIHQQQLIKGDNNMVRGGMDISPLHKSSLETPRIEINQMQMESNDRMISNFSKSKQQNLVFEEMNLMHKEKQKLVNRLFDKVQVGNINSILGKRENSQDPNIMAAKIVIEHKKKQQQYPHSQMKGKDILPPINQSVKCNVQPVEEDIGGMSIILQDIGKPATTKHISKNFRLQAIGNKRASSVARGDKSLDNTYQLNSCRAHGSVNSSVNLWDTPNLSLMLPPSKTILQRQLFKRKHSLNQSMIEQNMDNSVLHEVSFAQQMSVDNQGSQMLPFQVSYELQPVKNLMDEMVGINNTTVEYYNYSQQMKSRNLNALSKAIALEGDNKDIIHSSLQKEPLLKKVQSDKSLVDNNEEVDETRDVDSFIQAIRENKIPLSQFIYLTKKQPTSHDVYNMKVSYLFT